MKKLLMAAAALVCAGAAIAGPNSGGTLILATNPSIVYTVDTTNYCGQSGVTACDAVINHTTGADPAVLFAIAAFAPTSSPRLAGIVFGIQYDSNFTLLGQGPCADFELATNNWPASGEGTALTWNTAQTGLLTEVYWFAGYNYYAPDPAHVCLIPHPTQGAQFADDAVPANLDNIAGLGCFGFDAPGDTPCPQGGGPRLGACCLPNFTCAVLTADECAAGGGVYQGDDTDCDPDPCPPAPVFGACCVGDVCSITTQADCQGQYQGDNTSCDPNPCVVIPTRNTTWGDVKNRLSK